VRRLAAGTLLNEIFVGSHRWPDFQVLVFNPNAVTINDLAAGRALDVPVDISAFVQEVALSENIGYENGNDPSVTQASFVFRRDPNSGVAIRRGLFEDGVLVRVYQGDRRVAKEDWVLVFPGTFRGRPGDNPGTPADKSEGFRASAYGREERFLNLMVTTEKFDGPIDTGEIAFEVARQYMGLGQDEIRFGAQGTVAKHLVNQIVELPALQAIYECLFPAGKKPKFDADGGLQAVDVRLSKAPARIYPAGDPIVRSIQADPNDLEVNNSVVLRGLADLLTKTPGEPQLLTEFEAVTGFFDSSFKERVFYSQDRSQRAENTYLVARKNISWSRADWTEVDEFSGTVGIDTRYLRNVRAIIFATFLATQIAVAILDLATQQSNGVVGDFVAILRFILQVLSMVTLAALLWSMNYIGRGKYEVWGTPFEYVYRELVSRHQLIGLDIEEVREAEFRNDFVSSIDDLDALAFEHLKRELVKDQLYRVEILDDPLLEVDDVIEMYNGDRYYITKIEKAIRPRQATIATLTCWKIMSDVFADAATYGTEGTVAILGYGFGYGSEYGSQL